MCSINSSYLFLISALQREWQDHPSREPEGSPLKIKRNENYSVYFGIYGLDLNNRNLRYCAVAGRGFKCDYTKLLMKLREFD